tara:strand:+ start:1364 stop:1942 length:579 start_codon:yes stop_codon:yes gene_type:complete
MNLLYYSNHCQHSNQLLQTLSKSNVQKQFYYICIDKRSKDEKNNTIIQLENGKTLPLPPIINKVPSLLLQNHGNRVLTGNEILGFIQKQIQETEQTQVSDEPEPFGFMGSDTFVCSDNFSFLDTNATDLQSKGDGGLRQMHHYVPMDNNPTISTPVDNYVPDKIGTGQEMTIEKLQQDRDKDVYNQKMPYSK